MRIVILVRMLLPLVCQLRGASKPPRGREASIREGQDEFCNLLSELTFLSLLTLPIPQQSSGPCC